MVEVALFKELFCDFQKNVEDVLLNSSPMLRKGEFKCRKVSPAVFLSYIESPTAQDKINKKSASFRWLLM